MKWISLFSGIGGLDLAAHMMGFETVAFVEQDPYCQSILNKRFQGVPIYGDIREVTAERLKKDGIGKIDGCAGGFPCQGNSTAGKRKGKSDDRYLWPEMARITREINARWMVGENVRGILSVDGGELFGDVIRDLAQMGHSVGWSCYGACDVGASHKRERVFILAHSTSSQQQSGTKEQRILRTMSPNEREQYNFNRSSEACNLMWPTPKASLRADCSCERKRNTPDLASAVKMWPTPMVSDVYTGNMKSSQQKTGSMHSVTLAQVVMWPTPTAQDGKNSALPLSQKERDSVVGAVMREGILWGTHTASGSVRSDKYIRDGITPTEYAKMVGGQLNPDWVECLMGFPIGWTDIECDHPIPWPGNPAFMGQQQYDYEPPRVATRIKNRAKRLKALGNAVYTLQPLPIFKAIADIEYGRVV
ncbi:MAG: dcm [Pelosinus sp.]|nr:dcm [Pelosinus sp.]